MPSQRNKKKTSNNEEFFYSCHATMSRCCFAPKLFRSYLINQRLPKMRTKKRSTFTFMFPYVSVRLDFVGPGCVFFRNVYCSNCTFLGRKPGSVTPLSANELSINIACLASYFATQNRSGDKCSLL